MRAARLAVLLLLAACPHAPPPVPPVPPVPPPPPALTPLSGWVDLHTHPMANLGFAGKLVYGGPDWADGGGALLPSDPDCNRDVRATTLEQALGHDRSTHGGWDVHNTCGDTIRELVITAVQGLTNANDPPPDALGAPPFSQWPRSNDATHQVMWVESVRRAYDAGQRVLVALAVNNRTLADIVAGWSDGPDDDQSSADLQIAELKAMVARHSDFMEVAYSSADLQRIVAANHLAVVLGLEVDNLGNFNSDPNLTLAKVRAEVSRLKGLGVRYLFPIHLVDNPFGTTAAYQDLFDLSNLREAGHFWNLQCADPADQIAYRLQMKNPLRDPFSDPMTAQLALLMIVKLHLFSLDDPSPPPCRLDGGVVNRGATYPGLTPIGELAVREMMSQCMLLDVDHMSMASQQGLLAIAVDAGYPINSGHNDVRSPAGGLTERQLVPAQYATLNALGGMAGVGSARATPEQWVALSRDVLAALGDGGVIGFGTDSNGLSPLMTPSGAVQVVYSGSYPMSALGGATWDFNDAGVAHYGMLSDFLQAVRLTDGGQPVVDNLMLGAQKFRESWAKAESFCAVAVPPDAGPLPSHHHFLLAAGPACPEGASMRAACNRCLKPRERCPVCAADAGADAGCLPEPVCPPGRARNAWGVCSAKPELEGALDTGAKLQRAPSPGGAPVRPGKYVLTLTTPRDGKTASFQVELKEAAGQWTMLGRSTRAPANGGWVDSLWTLHWKSGAQVVMLVARPRAGAAVRGGFAVHRGRETVAGEFTLEPAPARPPAGAQPFEAMPAFLESLR